MNLDFERDLLRWVRDPELLLLVHTYVSPVFDDGEQYTFVRPDGSTTILRGVTTVLAKDLLEPLPPPTAVQRRLQRQVRAAVERTRAPAQAKLSPQPQERLTGRVRGSLVHRQIEQAVKMKPDEFFRENPQGLHSWGERLIQAVLEHGWKPVTAEFKVHDTALGIAYKIDLVCVDEAGRIIFVEHKTGYDFGVYMIAEFARQRWGRRTPLAAFGAATPLVMALVQHGLGVWLALRNLGLATRPRAATYRAFVSQVDGGALRLAELDDAFMDTVVPAVVRYLSS